MPTQNTSPQDNKQVVRRLIEEGWNQGKTNVVPELLATNCRFHDEVFPHLTSGADNLRRHIESCRVGFPDLKFSIDDTIAERDEVVVHWTARVPIRGRSWACRQPTRSPLSPGPRSIGSRARRSSNRGRTGI
jgi:hypothetical protein